MPDTLSQLKGCKEISMANQLRDILCSYYQDMLVLPYNFASRISPGNYGYQLVFVTEPASCNDSALPPGDRSTPIKPEYYSVLPKHDGESQVPSTVIQPDDLPGKLCLSSLLLTFEIKIFFGKDHVSSVHVFTYDSCLHIIIFPIN
jgi:hypothetical protein